MKVILGLFGLLLLVVIVGTYSQSWVGNKGLSIFNNVNKSYPTATIDNQSFNLILAKTQTQQEVGLSHRTSIPTDTGMLFIFNKPGKYGFWMNQMEFPIDIIYINNGQIVTIFQNVQPPQKGEISSELPIYYPTQNADKVLEINAGLSQKYNFKDGDKVDITGI